MREPGPGSSEGGDGALARKRLQNAVLQLSGELGYRSLTRERLLERAGVDPGEFDRHFRDLAECFAAAYEERAESLCEEMLLAAEAEGEWKAGTRAALDLLLGFAGGQPEVAKALIREVHVAGGAALEKHEEILDRLAAAVGSGSESPSEEMEPPRAPAFIVGAVEGVIAGHLDRGEPGDLGKVAPELMYLIVTTVRGGDAV